MLSKRIRENIDWGLLFLLAAVLFASLLNLYSVSVTRESLGWVFRSQLIYVGLGIVVFLAAALIDYKYYQLLSYPFYWIVNAMLLYVLIFGRVVAGSKRWIDLGPFHLQPSELAKIAVIMVLARYFSGKERPGGFRLFDLWKPILLTLIPMVLIVKEPDLGTSLMVGIVAFTVILIKGVDRKTLIAIGVAVLLFLPSSWFFVLKDYQKDRVKTFLNPERDARGSGYHIIQSKIAIGSGQFSGKGYLKNTQGKLAFLPKQHTDFVFAIWAEEWGFVGCMFWLALYFMLSAAALKIASKAKDDFGALAAAGIGGYLFWHGFVNMGMEVGLLPVVGVALPFMSYGGSSLITTMFAMGMLMSISIRRYLF